MSLWSGAMRWGLFRRPAESRLSIRVSMSPQGRLAGFEAHGHAGLVGPGRNVPCAAATSLLRTAGKLCAERGIAASGGAAEPGSMSLSLSPREGRDDAWLGGVTDFLLRGLEDLAREFPREIVLKEMTEV